MNIELTVLKSAIEEIDGGCGPCIMSFLSALKFGMEEDDFEILLDSIEIYGEKINEDDKKDILRGKE